MAESLNDFLAGYASGITGLIVGNPMDITKVRLQAGVVGAASSSETRATTLFQGTMAPMLTYGALNAILFTAYSASLRVLQAHSSDRNYLFDVYVAGAVAGLACWIVSAPTELYGYWETIRWLNTIE